MRVSAPGQTEESLDAITDALLVVSRTLVAISATSIADVDDTLSIPQYRMLVVLSNVGPANTGTLARLLRLPPPVVDRMVGRLVSAGLVVRAADSRFSRQQVAELSSTGHRVVSRVTGRRRKAIAEVVAALPAHYPSELVAALRAFAAAGDQLTFDVDNVV
jgi:DNA-binding MarR family transcriptional regulator